jgi:hypothetical protein
MTDPASLFNYAGASRDFGHGKAQKDLSKVRLNGCGPLRDGLRHCAARRGCVQRLTIE